MKIEQQYLKERVKYYPKNCEHIYERINIRIIAQIKFLSHSKAIESIWNKLELGWGQPKLC